MRKLTQFKADQCYDHESKQRMIRAHVVNKVAGSEEWGVTVSNGHEEIWRPLARVVREHPDGDTAYWCDTATGALYDDDGHCLSGHLWMIDKPRKTGRAVPETKEKLMEERVRSASYEYDDET